MNKFCKNKKQSNIIRTWIEYSKIPSSTKDNVTVIDKDFQIKHGSEIIKDYKAGTPTEMIQKYIDKKARRAGLTTNNLLDILDKLPTKIEQEQRGEYVIIRLCVDGIGRRFIVINPTSKFVQLEERACYVYEEIFKEFMFLPDNLDNPHSLFKCCFQQHLQKEIIQYWELKEEQLLVTDKYGLQTMPDKCVRPDHLYSPEKKENIIGTLHLGYGVKYKKLF